MKKKVLFVSLILIIISLYYFINIDSILDCLKTMNLFLKEILFVLFVVLQIVIAFLPGEPLELAAGYLFGSVKGTIICMIGSLIGTFIVYYLSKILKEKIMKIFVNRQNQQTIQKIMQNKHSQLLMFVLFLIPGTPKDVMTYGVGFMDIKLSHWLLLTTIGRIPSIITSTYIADMTLQHQYSYVLVLIVISIMLFVGGRCLYSRLPYLKGESKNGT